MAYASAITCSAARWYGKELVPDAMHAPRIHTWNFSREPPVAGTARAAKNNCQNGWQIARPRPGSVEPPHKLNVHILDDGQREEVSTFNRAEVAVFRKTHSDALLSDRNVETLQGYFDRNGVKLVSAVTLAAAYDRLSAFGLLEARPLPKPLTKSVQAIAPGPIATSELVLEAFVGWDPATGKPHQYTPYEVERMTADQYRRAFRVRTA